MMRMFRNIRLIGIWSNIWMILWIILIITIYNSTIIVIIFIIWIIWKRMMIGIDIWIIYPRIIVIVMSLSINVECIALIRSYIWWIFIGILRILRLILIILWINIRVRVIWTWIYLTLTLRVILLTIIDNRTNSLCNCRIDFIWNVRLNKMKNIFERKSFLFR